MKNTASLTVKRASALVAISGALLATTGCTYTNDPATTIVYSASDGVSTVLEIDNQQEVKVRNILVITSAEGEPGRLLGSLFNDSNDPQTLEINVGNETLSFTLEAGEVINLDDEANETIIAATQVAPGLMIKARASVGDASNDINLPVLDGTLAEYAPYVPSAAATSSTA